MHSKNALRSVLYVASRGQVLRSELDRFQREVLPRNDWGADEFDGTRAPLRALFAWVSVLVDGETELTVRELLQQLPASGAIARDVEQMLKAPTDRLHAETLDVLGRTIVVPRSQSGVRLRLRCSREVATTYDAAQELAMDLEERARLASAVDVAAALRGLQENQRARNPVHVWEARATYAVACAALANWRAVSACCESFGFVTDAMHRPHLVYIHSRVRKRDVVQALGVSGGLLKRSNVPAGSFSSEDARAGTGVDAEQLRGTPARARFEWIVAQGAPDEA